MKVLRAPALGMCFGVRDALDLALTQPDPHTITIHGALVHNEEVQATLAARGYHSGRTARPATDTVMITAHGISTAERTRLQQAGKRLIDTTCPLVAHVHTTAAKLRDEGRFVVVLGRHGHVEVEGIVGDLPWHAVVSRADDIVRWPTDQIGIVAQTTMPAETARQLADAIAAANPQADVRFVDTVCSPTKQRQEALAWFVGRVDAVVVIGGRDSHNTRQLAERCLALGLRTCHVRDREDLEPAWFEGVTVVGLTAGTSTPPWTVDDVEHALAELAVPR